MKLIDTHSHINFNAYRNDADEVIRRALDSGIGMFAVGSQITTSERAVEYAKRYDDIWAVIGLHPIHLFEQEVDEEEIKFKSREETFDAARYEALARSSDKVVAIGECGLDYYRMPAGIDESIFRTVQKNAFRAQVDLALKLDLPIMVHCRDAHDDLADILEEYKGGERKVSGQIHCFTGTVAEAMRYITLGMYISFTGIITFPVKNLTLETGETLLDVVKEVPLDRIIVETDAPYLSPVPNRGKRNEPAWVRHIAEKVAEVKGLTFDDVAKATLKNTKDLYGLDI